jgi:hypothetical protein
MAGSGHFFWDGSDGFYQKITPSGRDELLASGHAGA